MLSDGIVTSLQLKVLIVKGKFRKLGILGGYKSLYNYDSTDIRLRFERRSTPIRLQFDLATTILRYGLSVLGCCTEA